MSPTVSVIIPVYNQAQFIGQAIDSVLAQTFTDYEIIVVNDGSTDGIEQVLVGYGNRIQVINQVNGGLSAARNSGLQMAKGEIIGLLDADDLWQPHALSVLVTHLRENPDIDLVCGAWDTIDELGRVIKLANKPSVFKTRLSSDLLRGIAVGNVFLVHALLVRKRCFDECGIFDTNLKAVEDWDIWIRMAVHGCRVDLIDTHVARYRRHSGCMTYDPQRMERATRQVLVKIFSNDSLATRLADLQNHAYIYAWLSIAGFCQEAGLEKDRRRYVQMAEELYTDAPPNTDLSLLYLGKLFLLPETDRFMQIVAALTPQAKPLHLWLSMRRKFQYKQYGIALLKIAELMTSRPDWLCQKIFRRIGREIVLR